MEITENRLKHILAVANKMEAAVRKNPQAYKIRPEDAFVLGFLHDIGYKFADTQSEHAHKGGLVLKSEGCPFWLEIYCHGDPRANYSSAELDLLNFCDMTTGPDGRNMTITERLKDIKERYGADSKQLNDAIEIVSKFTSL